MSISATGKASTAQQIVLDRAPFQPNKNDSSSAVPDFNTLKSWDAPTVASKAHFDAGFRMQQTSILLAGNCHFGGWQKCVANDIEIVLVQGEAYRGMSVRAGYEELKDAAIISMRRGDGTQKSLFRDADVSFLAKPGEKAELRYIRIGDDAKFKVSPDGKSVSITMARQSALFSGDQTWRGAKVTGVETNQAAAKYTGQQFDYCYKDMYRSYKTGPRTLELLGRKVNNFFGGDIVSLYEFLQKHDPAAATNMLAAGYETDIPGNIRQNGRQVVGADGKPARV